MFERLKSNKESRPRYNTYSPTNRSPGILTRMRETLSAISPDIVARVASRDGWRDAWPKEMANEMDVYKKVSLVRQCINLVSDFSVAIGWNVVSEHDDLTRAITDMEDRTNFPEFLKNVIKRREIWGESAHEIVRDKNGNVMHFTPLDTQRLTVKVDKNRMVIDHFIYRTSTGEVKLEKKDVFYVTRDALDNSYRGVSSLESIKTTVRRKWNLEKDMEQAAKRLWAPYTLFRFNTSYVKDKKEQEKEIKRFIDQIEPGRTIVHNQQVEPSIINMTPDISALNQAIDSADQEIIGNWGIPKTLFSRGTISQNALEFSLRSMYESVIAGTQQYMKYEIENQIYDLVAVNMGYERGSVKHVWRPAKFHDSPVIRALTYAVKEAVISPKAMVTMLGWPEGSVLDVDDEVRPRERVPVADRPITMREIEDLLDEKLSFLKDREDVG